MLDSFPLVNWVTSDGDFFDYRPAIGHDGTTVIFERTYPNEITQLYKLENLSGESAKQFIPTNKQTQTRPDWNWASDALALNIEHDNGFNSIHTINANGHCLAEIDGTLRYIYPQYAFNLPGGGDGWVVMNNTDASAPQSTLIDSSGKVIIDNLNGVDYLGEVILGGMPAVFPGQATRIAFAGQPNIPNWGGKDEEGYIQDYNYIYRNAEVSEGNFISFPMEGPASETSFDPSFQGRAPAISPDGNYIAFESNRIGGGKYDYAIYLFNLSRPHDKPRLLTEQSISGNAQHPKFFPDGKKLIFTAINPDLHQSRVAWIDISAYL